MAAGQDHSVFVRFAAGIQSHQQGGGPEGTLIETRDDSRGGLDAAAIAEMIEKVIFG
jgi:hypothetical protein